MSKKAFDKIMKGLNEALAVARGEAKPAKLHVLPRSRRRAFTTPSAYPLKGGGRREAAGGADSSYEVAMAELLRLIDRWPVACTCTLLRDDVM